MALCAIAVKMVKSEFDWGTFDAILQFYPTKKICADVLGVSEDTIDRRINDERGGLNFKQYRDQKMGVVKVRLMKKAVSLAEGGNVTMLIFCLKNLCGWADKQEISTPEDKPISISYLPRSLRAQNN